MNAIVASTQPFLGLKSLFKRPVPTTPVAPALGSTPSKSPQRRQAFSMSAGDMQRPGANSTNPFAAIFVHPDVPVERKADTFKERVKVAKPMPEEGETDSFQSKFGKPKFRSALEQVSYLTNESAMNMRS